jgi:hypothetical protein
MNKHPLEDSCPALAKAARALRYLNDPANAETIERRERRRMRLFLPPLRETIETEYAAALSAAEHGPCEKKRRTVGDMLVFYE